VSDGSGNDYTVTLIKVLDPAQPDNSFDSASSGSRLVGAEFTVKGVSGSTSDDANTDAAVQGSDNQTYQPSFNGLAVGTNFNSGDFQVGPGQTETGWVAFSVPDSIRVASVQWEPALSGATATWNVTG
jgi:hypothetical protein